MYQETQNKCKKLLRKVDFRKWYTQCFCVIHSQRSNATDNGLFNLQGFINKIPSPRIFLLSQTSLFPFILESSNKQLNRKTVFSFAIRVHIFLRYSNNNNNNQIILGKDKYHICWIISSAKTNFNDRNIYL
jgi:hypothetical protein